MARYSCRCRDCGARNTLRKHPDEYRIVPQCQICGKRRMRIDGWMMRRDTRAMGCHCAGYNFGGIMHRRGSLYCWFRRDGTQRHPGDADFNDRNYETETIDA